VFAHIETPNLCVFSLETEVLLYFSAQRDFYHIVFVALCDGFHFETRFCHNDDRFQPEYSDYILDELGECFIHKKKPDFEIIMKQ